jgi:sterol desaturase/sphingolipid hydroxylase (fatty acid hydroxylase superfamily)
LSAFIGVFGLMALWELLAARRVLTTSKSSRWFSNLAITLLNVIAVRWVPPILPLGLAFLAEERAWGLLNNLALPQWMAVVVGVILLDCGMYLQHVLFHAIPLLWRLHMVHHADLDFDVTTGLRFHPIEIILSVAVKLMLVVVFGAPVLAVLIFEILLNATSMFNHGNVRLHPTADRYLRWLVVTPDMHRVHHSVIPAETNSNFGFNLPWWDRLFGTYRVQPSAGHEKMEIGLRQFRDSARLTLPWILVLPFVGRSSGYALGSRSDKPDDADRNQ